MNGFYKDSGVTIKETSKGDTLVSDAAKAENSIQNYKSNNFSPANYHMFVNSRKYENSDRANITEKLREDFKHD